MIQEGKHFDVGVVHTYGYSDPSDRKYSRGWGTVNLKFAGETYNYRSELSRLRPDKRTRLVVSAYKLLMNEEAMRGKGGNIQVDEFVASGRETPGEEVPLGTVTGNEAKRRLHKEVYVDRKSSITTSNELRQANRIAKNKKGTAELNILSVGWGNHVGRIKILGNRILRRGPLDLILRRPKENVAYKSAEEILLEFSSDRNMPRYEKIIDAMHDSERERTMVAYEGRVTKIAKIPYSEKVLDLVAKFYRPKV